MLLRYKRVRGGKPPLSYKVLQREGGQIGTTVDELILDGQKRKVIRMVVEWNRDQRV